MKEYGKAIVLLMIILLIWASCRNGASDVRADEDESGWIGCSGEDAADGSMADGSVLAANSSVLAANGSVLAADGSAATAGDSVADDATSVTEIVELVDFTGDGADEKVCIRWSESGAAEAGYWLAVYEQTESGWREIELPGMNVQVTLERLDDTRVRITGAAFGAGVELDVEKMVADQLWRGAIAGSVSIEKTLLMGESRLLIDTRTGNPVILLSWNLVVAGQYRETVATGILTCEEGEWKIQGVELGENVVWSTPAGEYLQKVN